MYTCVYNTIHVYICEYIHCVFVFCICICRVVGVTGMIEPKIGRKIIKDLIIKWDPEVDLRRLIYESYVVFHAGSFYDSPEVRF